MKIPILYSIKPLKTEDVFNTGGSHPILVHCSDLSFYVVKYPRNLNDSKLINELLSASFLKLWGLGIPEMAFVKIPIKHIPMGLHPNIQPSFFQNTCFGLKHSRAYQEVTRMSIEMSDYQRNLFIKKNELLEIALFDIWMSNEDRNFHNYNLMYDLESQFRFIPIDHQYIFNSGAPTKSLSLLTENETLIDSPFVKKLFLKKEIIEIGRQASVKNKFYLCVEKCHQNIDVIVDCIPDDWKINKTELIDTLKNGIFSNEWVNRVWVTFLEYLQLATLRK